MQRRLLPCSRIPGEAPVPSRNAAAQTYQTVISAVNFD